MDLREAVKTLKVSLNNKDTLCSFIIISIELSCCPFICLLSVRHEQQLRTLRGSLRR